MKNFIELKGTEKQVAWANEIRDNAINTINRNIEICEERNKKHINMCAVELQVWLELKEAVFSKIENIDRAAEIIDMRHMLDPRAIINLVGDETIRRNRK